MSGEIFAVPARFPDVAIENERVETESGGVFLLGLVCLTPVLDCLEASDLTVKGVVMYCK